MLSEAGEAASRPHWRVIGVIITADDSSGLGEPGLLRTPLRRLTPLLRRLLRLPLRLALLILQRCCSRRQLTIPASQPACIDDADLNVLQRGCAKQQLLDGAWVGKWQRMCLQAL